MKHERRRRGFEHVGCLAAADLGLSEERGRELRLAQAWRRVAGEGLARRTTVTVRRGVLEIDVPEAAWRRAIVPHAGPLAARLAAEFPDLGVRQYRLRAVPGERASPPQPVAPHGAGPAEPRAATQPESSGAAAAVEESPVLRLERVRDLYLGRGGE